MLCTEIETQPEAPVLDGAMCPDTQSLLKGKGDLHGKFLEVITPSRYNN